MATGIKRQIENIIPHYILLKARAQPKSWPQYLNIESNEPHSIFPPKFSLRNLDNSNLFSTVGVAMHHVKVADSKNSMKSFVLMYPNKKKPAEPIYSKLKIRYFFLLLYKQRSRPLKKNLVSMRNSFGFQSVPLTAGTFVILDHQWPLKSRPPDHLQQFYDPGKLSNVC